MLAGSKGANRILPSVEVAGHAWAAPASENPRSVITQSGPIGTLWVIHYQYCAGPAQYSGGRGYSVLMEIHYRRRARRTP
jgi:hypothetical protein